MVLDRLMVAFIEENGREEKVDVRVTWIDGSLVSGEAMAVHAFSSASDVSNAWARIGDFGSKSTAVGARYASIGRRGYRHISYSMMLHSVRLRCANLNRT